MGFFSGLFHAIQGAAFSRPKERDVAALVCMIITNAWGTAGRQVLGGQGSINLHRKAFLGVLFGVLFGVNILATAGS